MNNFPEIVTFRVTSRCNNDCKYCYGPHKQLPEMDLEQLNQMFDLFERNGVKAVVLTGGEPLLRHDFDQIVRELKSRGLKIFLDTAGDFFFEHHDIISQHIDTIGLPLDFHDSSYRNTNNHSSVIRILEYFKTLESRPTLRIGTVVTQDNVDQLEKIGELIKNYPVDIWKIYEYIPQNQAIIHKDDLEVSSERFSDAAKRMSEKFSKNFKIVTSKRTNRTNAYFFVSSDGNVFMPVDDMDICREIPIGNVFDDDIVGKWESFVKKRNYLDNAAATFNFK